MNNQILELSNEELDIVAGGAGTNLVDLERATSKLQTIDFVSDTFATPFTAGTKTALSAVNAKTDATKQIAVSLP